MIEDTNQEENSVEAVDVTDVIIENVKSVDQPVLEEAVQEIAKVSYLIIIHNCLN